MQQLRLQSRLICSLIILCLISAGISPACKFLSGQYDNFIEICTSFGAKRIATSELPQDFPAPNKTSTSKQCQFCLTALHLKLFTAQNQTYVAIIATAEHTPNQTRAFIKTASRHTPEARAPPAFS